MIPPPPPPLLPIHIPLSSHSASLSVPSSAPHPERPPKTVGHTTPKHKMTIRIHIQPHSSQSCCCCSPSPKLCAHSPKIFATATQHSATTFHKCPPEMFENVPLVSVHCKWSPGIHSSINLEFSAGGMDHLITTPSHHHISPLVRSRSRSETRAGPTSHRARSASFTANSAGGFTLPSYGYGGGYMAKSLGRSNSTLSLFGRGLTSSALNKTPPFHNVAVQRPTPHYSDKYPYVRYSYGNIETGLAIKTQTEMRTPNYYGIKDTGTKRWLEGKLNAYNTGIFSRAPSRDVSLERPVAPVRSYVKYMPTEDAVDLFKKRCMTVNTLSKYWLQSNNTRNVPTYRDYGRSSSISTLTGSYSSRYNPPPSSRSYGQYDKQPARYYSRVASSLAAY